MTDGLTRLTHARAMTPAGSYLGSNAGDSFTNLLRGPSTGNSATPFGRSADQPGSGAGPQSQGFTQQGPGLGRFQTWYRPGQAPSSGGMSTPPNAISTLGSGLSHDIGALTRANDYNFYREGNAAYDMGRLIQGIPDQINSAADRATGILNGIPDPNALGVKQVEDYYGRADKIMGNLEDMTAQEASAAQRGIARNYEMQTKLATKGFDEQGSPLTSAQKKDLITNLAFNQGQDTQQTITGIYSNFNQLRSQLATNLESIGQSVLGGQRDMAQLNASIKEMSSNIQTAAALNISQMQLNGQESLAQYIAQTPYSPVSWFSGLSALFNAASAPGARGVKLY